MISETIIKAAEIENAINFMLNQHLDNIVLATIPAGGVVSMRNGDMVIVSETDTPVGFSIGVTYENQDQEAR